MINKKKSLTILFFLIFIFSLHGCGLAVRGVQKGMTSIVNSELFRQGRHGKLNEQEQAWAKIAWKYFENNYHPNNGLVNGTDQFPVVSVWDIADILSATISAHHLEIISNYEFDHRITPLLDFLNNMELSHGEIPNSFYAANSGAMVDSAGNSKNQQDATWSAIDIGRLLIWMKILKNYGPQYGEYIDKAILRWNLCKIINECGELYGFDRKNIHQSSPILYDKEPIGYQTYAMMGYASWGFPQQQRSTNFPLASIYDINIPYAKEDSRVTGRRVAVVSLPALLFGLEFNWDYLDDRDSLDSQHSDYVLAEWAQRIYKVQEARYQQEYIFTARTDHRRNSEPYILYDAIFADGYSWNTLTPEGKIYPNLALVSTKAAFGMWALWKTLYTDKLIELVSTLYDPERGWFEGRRESDGGYERTISCTTNAMVLQSLYYKSYGKIYKIPASRSYADILFEDEFRRPLCVPVESRACQ